MEETENISDLLESTPVDHGIAAGDSDLPVPVRLSDTALELDDWSMRRGGEVFESSELLQKALAEQDTRDARLATADFHAAAFEPVAELAPACKNEKISRYMRNLMETPEFKALHDETQLDDVSSEIASAHFAKGYVTMLEKTKDEKPEGERTEGDDFKSDMATLGCVASALREASEEVEALRDMKSALGMGGNGGDDKGRMSTAEIRERFKKIKNSRQLSRICNLAGRYRRLAQAMQRKKIHHGLDDVVGVELGGDIGRLIPSELATLGDDDLELDTMRRIVERTAMQRSYCGIERKARGPIVVIVDESGSMNGEPIAKAKAFALAMYWIARHQRRWCCLIGYSGGCECKALVLPVGSDKSVELMEWLEHFYSGGSNLDVPVDKLPSFWPTLNCPTGATDIIQITDACCHIPPNIMANFLAWKAETQVKYLSIIVGATPGDLEKVSDRVWMESDLDIDTGAVSDIMLTV